MLKAIERVIKRTIDPIQIEGFVPPVIDPNAEPERRTEQRRQPSRANSNTRSNPKGAKTAKAHRGSGGNSSGSAPRPARSSGAAPRNQHA